MALGTTGISVSLIQTTLSESSTDVGTLCKSGKINKWSKYKPFRSATLFHTMAELLAELQNKNYGLTMPSLTYSWSDAVNNTSNAYTYNKPTGGSSSVHRMGDFRYYNHDAQPPAKTLSMPNIQLPFSGYKYATVVLSVSGGNYGIGLSDIADLCDCYLGVVLSCDNWSTVYLATSQDKIGDGATQVALGYHAPLIVDTQTTFMLRMVAVYYNTAPVPLGQMYDIEDLPSVRYLTLPFDAVSSNLVSFNVYPPTTVTISVFPAITWASSTSWSIPFKIVLRTALEDDLYVRVRGIEVQPSGSSTWTRYLFTGEAVRNYLITAGSTAPELTPAAITYSDMASPKPTLAVGDTVRVYGTVDDSSINVVLQGMTVTGGIV